jgi:ribosomal protein S18 acetylase RimI-like enzyme
MDKLITQCEDLFVVVCRPALPKDTADVMALTRDIWDGNDYVPYVWGEWLSDSKSMLVVAEYGGHVVGLENLSWKGSGEWWLQGLRVHPEYQGRGVASRLHNYIMEVWQQRLGGVIRLATSSARLPVHHLCQRTGFTRVGEFRRYVAPALVDRAPAIRPVLADEASRAMDYIRSSPLFAKSNHLIYLDWYWGEFSLERLGEIIKREAAYWWLGEGGSALGLLGIAVDEDDEQGSHLYIQFLTCSEADLPALLVDYRRLGHRMGYKRVEWLAPEDEAFRKVLLRAGFLSDWENSLFLFEKRGWGNGR